MKRVVIMAVAVALTVTACDDDALSEECVEAQLLYRRMELTLPAPEMSQANLLQVWPQDCPLPEGRES